MRNLQSLLESHSNNLAQAILASLKDMTLEELYRLSTGGEFSAGGRSASAPAAAAHVAAPMSRGPGRPKKVASAAAPAPKKTAPAAAPKKVKAGKPGRLPRRSAEDIASALSMVIGLLQANPSGLRSEQIRDSLNLDKREIPKVMMEGLDAGALSKTGQKRATVYFAAGGGKKGRKK